MKYKYKLTNMGESSSKFGPCEICNKQVAEVWHQSEERETGRGTMTTLGCHNLFGCRACLVAARKEQTEE